MTAISLTLTPLLFSVLVGPAQLEAELTTLSGRLDTKARELDIPMILQQKHHNPEFRIGNL
jgi:hypothetical protein